MEERNDFYVYVHTRVSDGSVFYVGKGKGKRAYYIKGRSEHWNNIAKKHGYNVTILLNNLTEEQAFILEKQTIATLGRENLCNMTDGGEGVTGRPSHNVGRKHCEETRKKMSEAKKGKPAPNKGKKHTEEARLKISRAMKGRPSPFKGKPGKKLSLESIAKRTATQARNRALKDLT